MSVHTTVTLNWRGGEHPFCLRLGEILALENKCNAGIWEICGRVETQRAWMNDIRETIRLGLIGGGMDPERANTACKLYVDEYPVAHSLAVAHEVLSAALVGVKDDDPLGKADAAETEAAQNSFTTTGVSAAQPSTELAQDLDGPPEKPTNAPFGNWPPVSPDITAPTAQKTPQSPHP